MINMRLKEVGIDLPHPNETLPRGPYRFRVTAPADAREVRISIDDGPWQPCRHDQAHWHMDWASVATGEHVAVARLIEADGSMMVTQPRLFRIAENG
jgi:hypothetical protein